MPGSTPNYAWPYQLLTDPPNGASLGHDGLIAADASLAAEAVARANADNAEALARTSYHQLVGRELRTTNMTLITAITRVVQVSAPVTSGRSYAVRCSGEAYCDTSTGTSQHELRYTTNGVDPVVTDTVLDRSILNHNVAGVPDCLLVDGIFDAGATGTLKVTLCTQRISGAGTINIAAASTFPLKLQVIDLGPTIANSGVIY